MNPIDDDTLQAYVDGELDPVSAARIDAALAHDPLLADRVRRARAVRAELRAAFDPVLEEPIPARLSALLQPSSQPVRRGMARGSAAAGHAAAARRRPRRRLVAGIAVAASVVLVGMALRGWWAGGDLVRMQDGQVLAAGDLQHALDEALASEPDPHARVGVGLSFRGTDGHICRTFVLRARAARAGLACHGDAGWSVLVLSPAAREDGELRPAASALPADVQAAVDARLRGDVFDAGQERAARAAGWR
ncbi:hypothetical protein [Fulvimonas yonginensis]|uniref:Putative zinc-finger domain-containing protein n=1 Tax=Fulvimonas yonginensis TaxID=1495200 RepID=A0ABU8JEY4_9GAMM